MDKYRLSKVLGEGSFAIVYDGVHRDGTRVAVKKIKEKQKSWEACIHMRELKSLKSLGRHANLVALKELVLEKELLYFVFEFLPRDLHKVVQQQRASGTHFTDGLVAHMASALLAGVGHMHSRGYMHRDLKPENVLSDESGTTLKIADLGLAREIRSRPPYTDYVATRWYRAPELVLGSSVYSSPVDVWAVGTIVYELLTLQPMLPGTSDLDMLSRMCAVLGRFDESSWKEGVHLSSRKRLRLPSAASCTLGTLLRQGRSGRGAAAAAVSEAAVAEAELLLRELLKWDPRTRPSCGAVMASSAFLKRADASAARMEEKKTSSASGDSDGSGRGANRSGSGNSSLPAPKAPASPSDAQMDFDADALLRELDGLDEEDEKAPAAAPDGPSGSAASGAPAPAHVAVAESTKRPVARKKSVKDSNGWPTRGSQLSASSRPVDDGMLFELFLRFDADSSGAIDRWELALLLGELGLISSGGDLSSQEAATRAWLSRMDGDGNGTVEWPELLAWWNAPGGGKAMVSAAQAFGRLRMRARNRRTEGSSSSSVQTGSAAADAEVGAEGATGSKNGVDHGDAQGYTASKPAAVDSVAAAAAVASPGRGHSGLSAADTHALRSLFSRHDTDFSGFIEASELLPLLVDLGVLSAAASDGNGEDGEADALLLEMQMMEMDANDDGKLSFDELCSWWASSGRGPPPKRQDIANAQALSRRLLQALDD